MASLSAWSDAPFDVLLAQRLLKYTVKRYSLHQGGHIPAKIKFPMFSLCYEFFPCVFFSTKLIMVLSNKGFARLVIAVFIIYGNTQAKKLVNVPCKFKV